MAQTWCVTEINGSFSFRLADSVLFLQNKLSELRNKNASQGLITRILLEGESALALCREHDSFVQKINSQLAGSSPFTLKPATQYGKTLRNFYTKKIGNWLAYYHIDNHHCIVIATLVQHTSDHQPISLQELLFDLVESLREIP